MNRLRALWRRQMYYPGLLGLFINPFFIARRGLADAVRRNAPTLQGRLLDIGCGNQPYRELFGAVDYCGLDIDTEEARRRGVASHFYDGRTFPFADSCFDSALCNQVLEHVFNPDEFLGETARVLKPRAPILFTMPFVWDEHEQPHDYARYSSFGLKALLEKNGFHILRHERLSADCGVLFQLFNAYLFKITLRWPRILRLAMTVSVMALVNILGVIAARILPRNEDLYLDHVVLAERHS